MADELISPTYTEQDWRKAMLSMRTAQEGLISLLVKYEYEDKKLQCQLLDLLRIVSTDRGRLEEIESIRMREAAISRALNEGDNTTPNT